MFQRGLELQGGQNFQWKDDSHVRVRLDRPRQICSSPDSNALIKSGGGAATSIIPSTLSPVLSTGRNTIDKLDAEPQPSTIRN